MVPNTQRNGGPRLICMSLVLAATLTFTQGQFSLSTTQQLQLQQQQRSAFPSRLTPTQQQQQRLPAGSTLRRFPAYRPAGLQTTFPYRPAQTGSLSLSNGRRLLISPRTGLPTNTQRFAPASNRLITRRIPGLSATQGQHQRYYVVPRSSLTPGQRLGTLQAQRVPTAPVRTAANTRVAATRQLSGLEAVKRASLPPALQNLRGVRVMTRAAYEQLRRQRQQQQARATQPQRQLSPNALLLRQQQKEIVRQRHELERLQKLLAQRQQPQIQPQPPQPQQQTAVNVAASNPNSVGADVNAVGTGGTQTGSQTGPVQSNSINAEAGPSPAGGVPGSDNLIVSGTGTGKGAADTGVKPSVPAPAAGVANTGTTAATPTMPLSPSMEPNPGPLAPAAVVPGPNEVTNVNPDNPVSMEPAAPQQPIPTDAIVPVPSANPNSVATPAVSPGNAGPGAVDTGATAPPPQQPNNGISNAAPSMTSNSVTTVSVLDVMGTAREATVGVVDASTQAPTGVNMAATTPASVSAQDELNTQSSFRSSGQNTNPTQPPVPLLTPAPTGQELVAPPANLELLLVMERLTQQLETLLNKPKHSPSGPQAPPVPATVMPETVPQVGASNTNTDTEIRQIDTTPAPTPTPTPTMPPMTEPKTTTTAPNFHDSVVNAAVERILQQLRNPGNVNVQPSNEPNTTPPMSSGSVQAPSVQPGAAHNALTPSGSPPEVSGNPNFLTGFLDSPAPSASGGVGGEPGSPVQSGGSADQSAVSVVPESVTPPVVGAAGATPPVTVQPSSQGGARAPDASAGQSGSQAPATPAPVAADVLTSIAELLKLHPQLLEQLLPNPSPNPASVLDPGTTQPVHAASSSSPASTAVQHNPPLPAQSAGAAAAAAGAADIASGTNNQMSESGLTSPAAPSQPAGTFSDLAVPQSVASPTGSGMPQSGASPPGSGASPSGSGMSEPGISLSGSGMSQSGTSPSGSGMSAPSGSGMFPSGASPAVNISGSVELVLAGPAAAAAAAGNSSAVPATTASPPQFHLMAAMQDPVFAHLLEKHLHDLMSQAGHARNGSPVNSSEPLPKLDLYTAMQDPVFANLMEAHLHQLMVEGKSAFDSFTTPSSASMSVPNTTTTTATTTTTTPSSSSGFSLLEAVKDPVFVRLMESYINEVMTKRQQAQTNAAPPATSPPAMLPTTAPTPVVTPAANGTSDPFQQLMLTNGAAPKTQPPAPSNQSPPSGSLPSGSLPNGLMTMLAFGPRSPPTSSSLPAVPQATFDSMEEVYFLLQYIKPTHPTVLGQVKYMLQVNPPRVKPNPATFTQVTTQQLAALSIPTTTTLETNAVSSAINVLANVYRLSVDQVLKLLKGMHPNMIARVSTTPQPVTGTGSTLTGNGTTATGTGTGNITTTMVPIATTTPVVPVATGEPTEAPEPGDPGFIAHHFRVGQNITHADIMMLYEMMP